MKFEENLAKHEIKNFAKISQDYENKNFAATLLLHSLQSATHPPLTSAKRFFNVARSMLLWDEDEYGTVLFHSVIYNSVGTMYEYLYIMYLLAVCCSPWGEM